MERAASLHPDSSDPSANTGESTPNKRLNFTGKIPLLALRSTLQYSPEVATHIDIEAPAPIAQPARDV